MNNMETLGCVVVGLIVTLVFWLAVSWLVYGVIGYSPSELAKCEAALPRGQHCKIAYVVDAREDK